MEGVAVGGRDNPAWYAVYKVAGKETCKGNCWQGRYQNNWKGGWVVDVIGWVIGGGSIVWDLWEARRVLCLRLMALKALKRRFANR